jgi:hypothetical protein
MGMSFSRARAETLSTARDAIALQRQRDETALQAGMAFARQRQREVVEAVAFAEAIRAKALSADIKIANLISADQARFQRVAGMRDLQGMNPLLEAERERRERIAEAGTEWLRRMAEACAPRIAPMEFGLGLNAIAALGSIGNLAAVAALADLHVPVRIHAVPRLPTQNVLCPGRSREAFLDRQPLSPIPEAPAHPEPTGWPEDSLEDEGGRRVLEQLSRFVRSEEIPSDAREGMSVLITWWKLNGHRITTDQSLEFNRVVQSFIGAQLGLITSSDHHKQLKSGLLVPLSESRQMLPAVELDPRIYTSFELSKILNYSDSTIRRQAEAAWTKAGGLGPCPLRRGSNWYVVEAAEDGGGQKRGWKFQQLSEHQEG